MITSRVRVSRAGFWMLPLALGLGVLILASGLFAASQTSASARMIQRVRARRLLDLAAKSAIDEAAGDLENHLRETLSGTVTRELTSEAWDAPIPLTHEAFAASGVTLGAVHVVTSELRPAPAGVTLRGRPVLGIGVAQLELEVRVPATGERAKAGADDLVRRVRARRYVRVVPASTGKVCAAVSHQNALFEEVNP